MSNWEPPIQPKTSDADPNFYLPGSLCDPSDSLVAGVIPYPVCLQESLFHVIASEPTELVTFCALFFDLLFVDPTPQVTSRRFLSVVRSRSCLCHSVIVSIVYGPAAGHSSCSGCSCSYPVAVTCTSFSLAVTRVELLGRTVCECSDLQGFPGQGHLLTHPSVPIGSC